MPGKKTAEPESAETDAAGVTRIHNVSVPLITIYPASRGSSVKAPAVIVCPGGGYGILAYNKEGTEIAAWLNSLGLTAVVLKYRVPGNREGALQDLQRAIRLVRAHAAEWKIDPRKTGVIGFSAGGHLAARLSTGFETPAYAAVDPVDTQRLRPDFAVLVYPAYLEKNGGLDPRLAIPPGMPPVFIAHTEDDHAFVQGSKVFHRALVEQHVRTEFLLVPVGGHGYGLRSDQEIKIWPRRVEEWLRAIGVL
jgi:acetyl esterase/lipase